jgi:hypothetical protein
MTPVPFEKTPVRVVDAPTVIDAGFAAKPVMEAPGGAGGVLKEFTHPMRPARHKKKADALAA